MLDTIGVAVAGWEGEPCRITREQAREVLMTAGGATVWGTRHKTAPALADLRQRHPGPLPRLQRHLPLFRTRPPQRQHPRLPGRGRGRSGTAGTLSPPSPPPTKSSAASATPPAFAAAAGTTSSTGPSPASATAGWLMGLRGEALGHAISLGVVSNVAMRQTRASASSPTGKAAASPMPPAAPSSGTTSPDAA